MASADVIASRKRSLEQSSIDEDQGPDHDMPSAKEPKLGHGNTAGGSVALDTLPTEILSQIASYLSTKELLSLRLANRTIEVQLFNDFAAYYFVKKQFMLTPESLQCLVDISLHPKLSTVLEHVIVSLDKYRLDLDVGQFPGPDPATSTARAAAYGQGAYDQAVFLYTGRDRTLLARAFRNLSNLKTVGLRDYNSGMRRRDGEGAEWSAYGATTVLEKTGIRLLRNSHHADFYFNRYAGGGSAMQFASRAFTTILQALGDSGAKPENIEILTRDKAHALPDYAFHIPPYLETTVAPVLAGLKSLLLTVDLSQSTPAAHASGGVVGLTISAFALERFLSIASGITHLRLNITGGMNVPEFMESLIASRLQLLPNLLQLDFGMIQRAEQDVLVRVVRRWKSTLKGLSFWKVGLDDTQAQKAALDPREKPNRWAELLVRLCKAVPGLETISVGCLSQFVRNTVQTLRVQHGFPGSRVYRRDDLRDLGLFRRTFEDEFQLVWPHDPMDGEDSSESEESEEDEDDDGDDA